MNAGKKSESYAIQVKIKLRNHNVNVTEQPSTKNINGEDLFYIPVMNHTVLKLSEKKCIVITREGDVFMCWIDENNDGTNNKIPFDIKTSKSRFISNIMNLCGGNNNIAGKEITMNVIVETKSDSRELRTCDPCSGPKCEPPVVEQTQVGDPYVVSQTQVGDAPVVPITGTEKEFDSETNKPITLVNDTIEKNKTMYYFLNECSNNIAVNKPILNTSSTKIRTTKREYYICNICGQRFSGKCRMYYILHRRKHKNFKPFKCRECSESFHSYDVLQRHENAKHYDIRKFSCSMCDKKFRLKGTLITHIRRHLGDKRYKCADCDLTFVTSSEVILHATGVHRSEKPFLCDLCGKSFLLNKYLRSHINSKHSEGPLDKNLTRPVKKSRSHVKKINADVPVICHVCGESFLKKDYLNIHIRKYHPNDVSEPCKWCRHLVCLCRVNTTNDTQYAEGIDNNVCTFCDYKGKSFFRLKMHMEFYHKSEQALICKVKNCYKTFTTKFDKDKHASEEHNNNMKNHSCESCHKKFRYPNELEKHTNSHHAPKLGCRCKHCGQVFATNDQRRKHLIAEHENLRKFACEVCGIKFFSKAAVKTHQRAHGVIKNFECPICGKRFFENASMKSHMLVHIDTKVYSCEQCGTTVPISTKSELGMKSVCITCKNDMKIVKSLKTIYETIDEPEYQILYKL